MSDWTDAIKEAFTCAPAADVVIESLQISHPDFASDIFIANNTRENLTLTLEDTSTEEFQAVAFNIKLPPAGHQGMQELQIRIDDTAQEIRDIITILKASKEPAEIKYRPYLANDLTTPQISEPLSLFLRNANITVVDITARATFADYINKSFPSEDYTRSRFPSIGE